MDLKNLTAVVELSDNLTKVNAALAVMNDRYSGELTCTIGIESENRKSATATLPADAMMTALKTEKARLEMKLSEMGVKL